MKKIFLILVGLALALSCKSEKWHFSVTGYGLRIATISKKGSAAGHAIKTALSVLCRPGKEGTISINYTVYDADTGGGFNFDSFEGPYAPAASKKLMDIGVAAPGGTLNIQTEVAGYYLQNKTFIFSRSALNSAKSDARAVAEALIKGAESIRITVHDMIDPAKVIETDFPAAQARSVIEKTVDGCLKD
jgi:hypothetical protein